MPSKQQPYKISSRIWSRVIWHTLTSPHLTLWLLAFASLGCLLISLIPQIPLDSLRIPTLADLWLKSIKTPWVSSITFLHSIGLTHLVQSRVFYIYCALALAMVLLSLIRLFVPLWAHPVATLITEQYHLGYSKQEAISLLERSTALVGLKFLHKSLPYTPPGGTAYFQGVSSGIRRWGPLVTLVGLVVFLVAGLLASWSNTPADIVAVSPGEVMPLPEKPDSLLRLLSVRVLDPQNSREDRVRSDWIVTTTDRIDQLKLLIGNPVHLGSVAIYLLGDGPAVQLTARNDAGQILQMQRVLGDTTPHELLRLRFDLDQQEQLVAIQNSGVLLRLIHYPSLPAQGINGRTLHVQVLHSDTGDLVQQAYLDKSASLSIAGITVDITLDYYVLVRVQKEPWLWLFYLGGSLAVAGLFLSLFAPYRELWLALTPSATGIWCQLWLAPDITQESWMQTWRSIIREEANDPH